MNNIIEDIYYEEKTNYYYQKKYVGENYYFAPINYCQLSWKLIKTISQISQVTVIGSR